MQWPIVLQYPFSRLFFSFLLSVLGALISPFLSPQVAFQNDLFSRHTRIGIGHLTTTTAIIYHPFPIMVPCAINISKSKNHTKKENKQTYAAAPVAWSKKSRD
jgi:hypothetical protein